jgi:toxin ParE1/3/4
MLYEVLLTNDALRDLEKIYDYIFAHDSREKAEILLNKIERIFTSLSHMPERGTHPKELLAFGIKNYRQIMYKPYRIIYGCTTKIVHVYLIADGRQDMQTLLQNRLLAI